MSSPSARTLSDDEKDQMRRWLDNWRRVGPILEQERADRLRHLTDMEAAAMACDLWKFGRPGGGDDAEGLLPMKRTLQRLLDARR